jgi:hypothetical protein
MKETSQEVYDIIYNLNLDNFLTEKKHHVILRMFWESIIFFVGILKLPDWRYTKG